MLKGRDKLEDQNKWQHAACSWRIAAAQLASRLTCAHLLAWLVDVSARLDQHSRDVMAAAHDGAMQRCKAHLVQ